MITTLIHRQSPTQIQFRPMNIGSHDFQELACKVYTAGSIDQNLRINYRTTEIVEVNTNSMIDGSGSTSPSTTYYPYACFKGRRLDKIGLCEDGKTPQGYEYYTKINYPIETDSAGEFINFGDVEVYSNVPSQTTVLSITETMRISVEASEFLPQHKVITTDGYIASSSDITQRAKIAGIGIGDTDPTFLCDCVFKGVLESASFSFTPHQLLYLNGTTISETAPSSGYILQLGKSLTANKILVDIRRAILF